MLNIYFIYQFIKLDLNIFLLDLVDLPAEIDLLKSILVKIKNQNQNQTKVEKTGGQMVNNKITRRTLRTQNKCHCQQHIDVHFLSD